MDIGWYNPGDDTLYLVELKDFTFKNIADKSIADAVVFDLVKKSVDSMSMIMAVKAGTSYSAFVRPCLPSSFNLSSSLIKIIHIINCPSDKEDSIQYIHDKFKEHFKAYQRLFDVQHCAVVSLRSAKKFLSPVQ